MTERLHNFVDGGAVEAKDGRTTAVVDPSTGEVFAEAPLSGPEDVDLACQAAADAFESWRDTTPSERSRMLLKLADAIERTLKEKFNWEAYWRSVEEHLRPHRAGEVACRYLEVMAKARKSPNPKRL